MSAVAPQAPSAFLKLPGCESGPGAPLVLRASERCVDYEGELAVVIGSVARSVSEARWREVVLGYTCGVDATARDLQEADPQWVRAKGFDTSAPLGPWIETEVDPSDLGLQTRVNGAVKQDSRTSQLIFGVGTLVAFVTSYVTLLPGDVILTGTPSGIGPVSAGDRVEVEIEGVGTLTASVRDGPGS